MEHEPLHYMSLSELRDAYHDARADDDDREVILTWIALIFEHGAAYSGMTRPVDGMSTARTFLGLDCGPSSDV